MNPKIDPVRIGVLLLLLLNIFLFLLPFNLPILYQQGEMTWMHIFWSQDLTSAQPQAYHTGLRKADFLKLFMNSRLDNVSFRLRQFSYLWEMLGFKLWQFLNINSFYDFSLILLHVGNMVLLGLLLFYLTGSRNTAFLGALFFLNASDALATLQFPFRNAKLLSLALFLLAWITVAREQPCNRNTFSCRPLFFLFLLLALFTDEITLFLFPIIFLFIAMRDGAKAICNRKIAVSGLILAACVFIFLKIILQQARILNDPIIPFDFQSQITNFPNYLHQFHFLRDTLYAFFFYFLRRTLGHWDLSPSGLAALAAVMTLVYLIYKSPVSAFLKKICWMVSGISLFKNLFFPHPGGLHPFIMPPNTVYPSTLFFGYYVTYPEAMLLIFCITLLLSRAVTSSKNIFLVTLLCVTVISASNSLHAYQVVSKAILFHQPYINDPTTAANILSVKHYLRTIGKTCPLYVSFPSGGQSLFFRKTLDENGRLDQAYPDAVSADLDLNFRDYCSILPIMYLRPIEQGRLIISLDNTASISPLAHPQELTHARFFLDITKHRLFDLNTIRVIFKADALIPKPVQDGNFQQKIAFNPKQNRLILFIIGAAEIKIESGSETKTMRQQYGQSYELFEIKDFNPTGLAGEITLTIHPLIPAQQVKIVGPFLF